ncbi:hypothetical protein CJ030_MR5G018737 [Morella rubra]|uniref:Uncharacterized protein n=1 Tax=Morella rubra TaxID=262757 RepID=A0A6A1VQ37_9ROSI|nr:hypothetical protein CJ030_MR5G018737 [Morella rubra]
MESIHPGVNYRLAGMLHEAVDHVHLDHVPDEKARNCGDLVEAIQLLKRHRDGDDQNLETNWYLQQKRCSSKEENLDLQVPLGTWA